jgi:hypothetical protein
MAHRLPALLDRSFAPSTHWRILRAQRTRLLVHMVSIMERSTSLVFHPQD